MKPDSETVRVVFFRLDFATKILKIFMMSQSYHWSDLISNRSSRHCVPCFDYFSNMYVFDIHFIMMLMVEVSFQYHSR